MFTAKKYLPIQANDVISLPAYSIYAMHTY